MTITQAEKMHAVAIAKLIMQAMNYDCCQYFAGPEHTLQDFEDMMIRLVEADNSQYSYRNSIVALADDGNVAGVCVSYDGKDLRYLRRLLLQRLLKLLVETFLISTTRHRLANYISIA